MTIQCEIKHPVDHSSEKGFHFSGLGIRASNILSSLTAKLVNTLEKQKIANDRRAALKDLAGLSEATLLDIGISKDNAKWAYDHSAVNSVSDELDAFLDTKKVCK